MYLFNPNSLGFEEEQCVFGECLVTMGCAGSDGVGFCVVDFPCAVLVITITTLLLLLLSLLLLVFLIIIVMVVLYFFTMSPPFLKPVPYNIKNKKYISR